jgi:hypothetical protein
MARCAGRTPHGPAPHLCAASARRVLCAKVPCPAASPPNAPSRAGSSCSPGGAWPVAAAAMMPAGHGKGKGKGKPCALAGWPLPLAPATLHRHSASTPDTTLRIAEPQQDQCQAQRRPSTSPAGSRPRVRSQTRQQPGRRPGACRPLWGMRRAFWSAGRLRRVLAGSEEGR